MIYIGIFWLACLFVFLQFADNAIELPWHD